MNAAQLAARTARQVNDFPQSRLYGHDAGKLATRRAGALARRDAPDPAPAARRAEPSLHDVRVEPHLERGPGARHRRIPPGEA